MHVLGLGDLALVVEFNRLDACLGRNVGEARQDSVSAGHQSLDGEIRRASENQELGVAGVVVLGEFPSGRSDAVHLARVAARELDTNNVGVLRQLDNDVRRQIHAVHGAGVVVDDEGDGRGVRDGVEELDDGLASRSEQGRVVGRRKDQGVVATSLPCLAAELNRLPRALSAAADDNGHPRETSVVECFPGCCCHKLPLGVGEMNSLAVGSLRGESGHTGAGEPHGVPRNGGRVDVFGTLFKEAHGGHIDAGYERPSHVEGRVVQRRATVGAAQWRVGLVHTEMCRHEVGGGGWAEGPVEAGSEAARGGGRVVVGSHCEVWVECSRGYVYRCGV